MDILLSLLLLLLAARASGELAQRLKLPALLGEILAGVVLGPSLLGLVSPDAGITLLANLGIFFIVYLAALELTLKDVKRSIRESGVFIAITSFIIPLLSGVALGRLLALPLGSSMFLGIALAFTALPVSIGILTDLELLETDFGRSIVSAGLLCDVAGLAMIGVVLNVSASAGFDPLAMGILVLRFAAFTGLLIAVDRLFRYRQGFLGPIFFAFIGLSVVVKSLADAPLVLSILAVAVLSKFIGGYAGARWSKFSQRYSVAAGVAMNGRGAMELVVAAIGLELGLIDESLFSILVLMGVVTTFLMTLGLRFVLPANIRDRLAFGSSTAEQGSGGINGGA